ncbi:hypothetical protein [Streptomyces sp. NPDC058664]|uniref:hypothetical protein n=1 Tax=unclassified Streptomyces TaxID=2593676 RepID=UPI00364BCBE2
MKYLGKALVTAVAASAVLCGGFSTTAQAARGSFTYHVDGWRYHKPDPQDDHCYNMPGQANELSNHTDRTAVLFHGTDCRIGDVVTFLEPGQWAPDHFYSVKFLSP